MAAEAGVVFSCLPILLLSLLLVVVKTQQQHPAVVAEHRPQPPRSLIRTGMISLPLHPALSLSPLLLLLMVKRKKRGLDLQMEKTMMLLYQTAGHAARNGLGARSVGFEHPPAPSHLLLLRLFRFRWLA